ncbi:MAG: LysE family transporter [Clostridia bacterium]|nr:LysE family transporter [Clostridia bacterium]
MISVFLKSFIIAFSGAAMPGPMFTYTVERSIRHGVGAGLFLALGHASLELILVILLFVGVGKYLAHDLAGTIIGLVGGLVLIYLGFGMIKEVYLNKISLDTAGGQNHKQGNVLLAGVVLSVTNPYFIIWWTAVGLTLIMDAYNSFGFIGIVLFYIGHILADITWFTFVSALVSRTRHLINIKIYKVIIFCLGLCLIGFGISFLFGA